MKTKTILTALVTVTGTATVVAALAIGWYAFAAVFALVTIGSALI